MNLIEDLINQILSWYMGGLGVSALVVLALFVVGSYLSWILLKKIAVYGFLFIATWLPSIVVAHAVDYSVMQSQPLIPLKGYTFILFPYTWDVLLGYFGETQLGVICLVMILLSYVAFLQVAYMFCKKYNYKTVLAPVFAYIFLVALGLGMINFHVYAWKVYKVSVNSVGVNEFLPIVFFLGVIVLIIVLKVLKQKKLYTTTQYSTV